MKTIKKVETNSEQYIPEMVYEKLSKDAQTIDLMCIDDGNFKEIAKLLNCDPGLIRMFSDFNQVMRDFVSLGLKKDLSELYLEIQEIKVSLK
jgi:hypothetical protein